MELEYVEYWYEFCSGSIVHENWILTAAHCFTHTWNGDYFSIAYGKLQCMPKKDSIDKDFFQNFVVDRTKTLYEHPLYHDVQGDDSTYDVALLRLEKSIRLPRGRYNGEPLNRVCIYSSYSLPKNGCLKNVYSQGYGMKMEPDGGISPIDPYSNLSYVNHFRASDSYCSLLVKDFGHDANQNSIGEYCFSPIPSHSNLVDPVTQEDVTIWSLEDLKSIPNVCPGDSGGPLVYYMRYDDHTWRNLSTGYRALQISIVGEVRAQVKPRMECEFESYRFTTFLDTIVRRVYPSYGGYYKPPLVGPKLYQIIGKEWWNKVFSSKLKGNYPVPTGAYAEYPDTI